MLDEVDHIGSAGHDREPGPPSVVQPATQPSGSTLLSGTQATSGTILDALDVPAPTNPGPSTATFANPSPADTQLEAQNAFALDANGPLTYEVIEPPSPVWWRMWQEM